MKPNWERVIGDWVDQNWADKGYLKFDDLHLDRIDPNLADSFIWLEMGVECLGVLEKTIRGKKIPLWGALAFSLKSSDLPRGINFNSEAELHREYDDTPPSLYLFERQQAAWLETPKTILEKNFLRGKGAEYLWLYSEYLSEADSDYRRNLWVVFK